ncbi:D-alanine--D-alanine ligase [Candidatus Woesearchaeota archaeon]|nr:D-alanine--D-alanine ligase [Candidatus Woesearchaeota archaeon]
MLHVGLTFNKKPESGEAQDLPDDFFAEFDTDDTILAIGRALESMGNRVTLIEADEEAYGKLRRLRPDIVFNFAEGIRGESRESHVPAFCEMLGIPYHGSGPLTLGIGLNKARSKETLIVHGVPTPRSVVLSGPVSDIPLRFPLIVKPIAEGSSKGIRNDSLVRDIDALNAQVRLVLSDYGQAAIAEEFMPGDEFTVGVLGNEEPIVLPIIKKNFGELPPEANPIDSFEAKWVWDTPEKPLNMIACEPLPKALAREIRHVVIATYRAFDCKDWARIDLRLDAEGRVNVLEINPIPGLLPKLEENSCLPRAGHEAGLSYAELVNAPLYYALIRHDLLHKAEQKAYARLGEKLEAVRRAVPTFNTPQGRRQLEELRAIETPRTSRKAGAA